MVNIVVIVPVFFCYRSVGKRQIAVYDLRFFPVLNIYTGDGVNVNMRKRIRNPDKRLHAVCPQNIINIWINKVARNDFRMHTACAHDYIFIVFLHNFRIILQYTDSRYVCGHTDHIIIFLLEEVHQRPFFENHIDKVYLVIVCLKT